MPPKGFVEGDEGFGSGKSEGLEFGVDDFEEVLVVFCVEFDKKVVSACGVVAFYDFGDESQGIDHGVELFGFFEKNPHVGGGFVAHFVVIDDVLGAFEDSEVDQFLDALVDGCAGDGADPCDFEKGDTGVTDDCFEDFLVEFVELMMSHDGVV
jgi:hypothetical protein